MKTLIATIIATIALSTAIATTGGIANASSSTETTYSQGQTDGAHDLCQELGGEWQAEGWCDIAIGSES